MLRPISGLVPFAQAMGEKRRRRPGCRRRARERALASRRAARIGLLGLGSNVGERRAHLQAAVDALAASGVESAPPPRPTTPTPSARCSTSRASSTPASGRDGARAARAARHGQGARARARAARRAACATARARSTSTCCCSATSSSAHERHDAAARAAAQPALRADPRARARLLAARARRCGASPTRSPPST